ncbi:hypothetical protein [Neorhizobium sp. T6_25]|uniref:hypothetical protein n=1 Tax=Neorhizobium sp. T6_25 TaxID=2093833 RepID=UPI000CF8FC25|nr:hypothetical protein [Neorhizobium sp. T6_25]
MKKEIADRLSKEYANLWDDSMRVIPDGWITPLLTMLDRLYGLSDVDRKSYQGEGLSTWVDLHIDVSPIVAIAYATPLKPAGKWTPGRALACVEALAEFSVQTGETCRTCGEPGIMRLDGIEGIYCDQHRDEEAAKIDKYAALYDECRVIFPAVHGKAIDLHVPDFLYDLLASSLRKIKQVVEDEGGYLEGKIKITRLEMIDGQLHVRHVYDQMPAGAEPAMMEIDDTIRWLEGQSDELVRKHNSDGGSDAS